MCDIYKKKTQNYPMKNVTSFALERCLKEQIHLSHFTRGTRKRTYGEW